MRVTYEFGDQDQEDLWLFTRAEEFYQCIKNIRSYIDFAEGQPEDIDSKDVVEQISNIIENARIDDF